MRVGGISLSLPGRPLRVLRGRHFGLEKGLPYHSGGPPSGERDLDFWLYEQESLDIPVSPEIPVPRLELLSMPHGDFQNSVCLHDFLHRIKSRDTRLMAYDLMAGDTIDEIRTYRRWSRDHTYRTYNRLRLRMEEYLSI